MNRPRRVSGRAIARSSAPHDASAPRGRRPGAEARQYTMTFLRTAWLVLRKDFAIEVKSWEILTTTLFFAASCVLVFAFAFVKEGRAVEDAAAGILWIAVAFSGTLALGRTFERERYGETLRALLMAPASRPAIYLGKLLGMLLLILLYPIAVPVIIAGVLGTNALAQAPPDEAIATLWIGLLTAFDVVF